MPSAAPERPPNYPDAWVVDALLADGATVHIRPIRPADAAAHRAFFAKQSPESVYFRFFSSKRELSESEVEHFTNVDYHDRMAFVALLGDEMIGIGRYDRLGAGDRAEVAFAVADEHQGRGIGSLLLEYLAAYAPGNGIIHFTADTLLDNRRMLDVFDHAGYRRESASSERGVRHITFGIEPTGASLAIIDRRAWTAGTKSTERILRPGSVAVVGAGRADTNIGHAVVRNLVSGGFTGPVYPVNPNATAIDGVPCFPSIEAIPNPVDLAVLVVPADQCLDVVEACARKQVRGLAVISSGFAEIGSEGAAMQRELILRAHRGGMRVVGPNCFGVINTAGDIRMNATFALQMPVAGRIAFASQSGALGVAVLERSLSSGLGLSSFVSMGNKADVSSNDLLRYWSQDDETRVILLYLESFGSPRAFARVAPVVSRQKPIVVVKSGRSAAGTRAAASHTAAMASTDTVVDALFRQAGVIRVDTLEELLDCGGLLADQPAIRGSRVAIIGNAGGAAVLAADACVAAGLEVPEFDSATQQTLRAIAGPNAAVANPVDVGGGATPELFRASLAAVLESTGVDGVIVIFAPVASAPSDDVARAVAGLDSADRPLMFVHLGSDAIPEALRAGTRPIPCYAFPERAVQALGRVAEHARWLSRSPGAVPALYGIDAPAARNLVTEYLEGQPEGGWLPPAHAHRLLDAFGIPVVSELDANSAEAAAKVARKLGWPVVMKAVGEGIIHKSDIDGVRLNLASAAEVRHAYVDMEARIGQRMRGVIIQPMLRGVETIAGVVSDPVFGPVVMFGSGGTAVELLGDQVFRILPLTDVDAAEMVRSIRGAPLLQGYRGTPACDIASIEDVLLRVARLADEIPQVAEMDLNPLMATPQGAYAVDTRIRILPWRHHAESEIRRLR